MTERASAMQRRVKEIDRSKNRGRSSAGRAPALHAGGQEFDPPRLHQLWNNLQQRLIQMKHICGKLEVF